MASEYTGDVISDTDVAPKRGRSPLEVALQREGITGPEADIARSIYQQESGQGRNKRTSNAGAVGGMQIKPDTFKRFADKGWSINNEVENSRAAVRYIKSLHAQTGGDPKLTAAGYYGGEGAIPKARRGIAISDPRNPSAPNTLQYADQVVKRVPKKTTDKTGPQEYTGEVIPLEATVPQKKAAPSTALERLGTGLADPIHGGAQLLTHLLPESIVQGGNQLNNWLAAHGVPLAKIPTGGVDQMIRERENQYQAARQAAGSEGIDVARIAGNIASPVNLAGGAAAPRAMTTLGKLASGIGQGAFQSSLAPVTEGDYASEKLKQVAAGAAVGGAVPTVTGAAAKVISPAVSKAAQTMMKAGIPLTPGQLMGGMARSIEEKLSSQPFIGEVIRSAEQRGIKEFNRATIDRALSPIGEKLPKGMEAGHEAIEYGVQKISDRYDALLPKMSGTLDKQLSSELNGLKSLARNGTFPKERADQLDGIIKNEVLNRFTKTGKATGVTLKQIESKLGNLERSMRRDPNYDVRNLGDAVATVQKSLRDMMLRENPQYAKELGKINSAFSQMLRPQTAAARIGAEEGVFTPAQLRSVIRELDPSRRKSSFAKGKAMGQEFAESAKNVLPRKIPSSGTAERLSMAQLAAAIPGLAAMLGPGMLYTPMGQRVFKAAMTARPQGANELANLVRASSPALISGAAPAALPILSQGE